MMKFYDLFFYGSGLIESEQKNQASEGMVAHTGGVIDYQGERP